MFVSYCTFLILFQVSEDFITLSKECSTDDVLIEDFTGLVFSDSESEESYDIPDLDVFEYENNANKGFVTLLDSECDNHHRNHLKVIFQLFIYLFCVVSLVSNFASYCFFENRIKIINYFFHKKNNFSGEFSPNFILFILFFFN